LPLHLREAVMIPAFTETLGLMVGRAHPLYERQAVLSAEDVARLQFALLTPDFITRTCIDEYFMKEQITPKVAIEVNSVNTLLEVIQHTAIATILPEPIASAERALSRIPLMGEGPKRGAALLRRKNNYHSAAALAFVELVLGAATF
jgi:LysR family cyn operon transcriptional activator